MSSGSHKSNWNQDNIGILAYGSLLTGPGQDLTPHIIDRIPQETPWPVEYARQSESRGGAPTLVRHPKGSKVKGQILVLDMKRSDELKAREWLRIREGRTAKQNIKAMELGGLRLVLYADLPANIPDDKLSAESLAEMAIASVGKLLERNGVSYLADNIDQGIGTPLTEAYQAAVLAKTATTDLRNAIDIVAGRREGKEE